MKTANTTESRWERDCSRPAPSGRVSGTPTGRRGYNAGWEGVDPAPKMSSHLGRAGFTLIEMLAAVGILTALVLLLFTAFHQGQRGWLHGQKRAESFQEARRVLSIIAADLELALTSSNIYFSGNSGAVTFVSPLANSDQWAMGTNTTHYLTNEVTALTWLRYEWVSSGDFGYVQRKVYPPTLARANSTTVEAITDANYFNHVYGTSSAGNPLHNAIITSNNIVSLEFLNSDGSAFSLPSSNTNLPPAIRIRIKVVDLDALRKMQRPGADKATLRAAAERTLETQVALVNYRPE